MAPESSLAITNPMTNNPNGFLLHEGITPSGAPFVAIATMHSRNPKTGDMVQIWFLLRDVNPVQAVKEGIDAETICVGCKFASGNGCYIAGDRQGKRRLDWLLP
jgi:hypothetical protein